MTCHQDSATAEMASQFDVVIRRAEQAARGERVEWLGSRLDPRYRLRDQKIIEWLEITEAEMRTLGLRHLATPEIKRELERQRKTNWRRRQGMIRRDEYLDRSTEREKPWEAEGISRANWYRRRS